LIQAAERLAEHVGVLTACQALGVPRSAFYRAREKPVVKPSSPPPRVLSSEERAKVHQVLNSERFQDDAPRKVYATLLDEGIYLCHWRTMYRILEVHNEVRERRNQLCHPNYQKPELLATGPNQVWSWDITKLLSPVKWTYYLYVILDIFSRYVVGWMIADCEAANLARELITETCAKQDIEPEQLTGLTGAVR
jgi:putative transposase